MSTPIDVVTIGALALTGYHHVGYPLLMRFAAKRATGCDVTVPAELPEITLVMPAYNEATYIADKIRNIAALDYPADRLRVVIACDGCSDLTAEIARATLREPAAAHLIADVLEHTKNRGKITVLNETIRLAETEIIALSDVSAMLPADALTRAAAHFTDPKLGAVGGTYRLAKPGSKGEQKYWEQQVAVKRGEARLGAPLGLHGAFYALRREAWKPLPANTVNDDFIVPMMIYGNGWRVAYDETIVALEVEQTRPEQEKSRRRRIGAGNVQQLLWLSWLLHPRNGGVALAFGSGKALRVIMPLLMAVGLLGSVMEARSSVLFALLAALQLTALAAAALGKAYGASAPRLFTIGLYIVEGHFANLMGLLHYARGATRRTAWRNGQALSR